MAGKQVFLPVMAFNALYGWGGGEGQTSATYLLGRDARADKLDPFRLDLGPRIFRTVAARLLPTGFAADLFGRRHRAYVRLMPSSRMSCARNIRTPEKPQHRGEDRESRAGLEERRTRSRSEASPTRLPRR